MLHFKNVSLIHFVPHAKPSELSAINSEPPSIYFIPPYYYLEYSVKTPDATYNYFETPDKCHG